MCMARTTCLLVLLGLACRGAGDWHGPEHGTLAQRDRQADVAETTVLLPGQGGWRCVVEPGPYGGGIALHADGLGLELLDKEGGTFRIVAADGRELWRDPGAGWVPYEPVWVEVARDEHRIRAHLLLGDGKGILAMSPWLPGANAEPARELKLATMGNTARFALWQRAATPLVEYTPDNPSALRVPQAGDASWQVVGGGAWRWRTGARQELQQTRPVERTTLVRAVERPGEGVWRCRIRLDKPTCGGGMLVLTDAKGETGYLVWCGGTYGNGSLMLYRRPGSSLWSSSQGKWRWNTQYVLEARIAEGTIQARLLGADGATEIAVSKPAKLLPEEIGKTGMVGYQTWRGTGSFWPAGEKETVATPVVAEDLGGGWRAVAGDWELADGNLRGTAGKGVSRALCETVRGARGAYRCRVTAESATSVALLFQHGDDAGFACRLDATGTALLDGKGEALWSDPEIRLAKGRTYILEGVVETDRVSVRVRDADGKTLVESVERYVSDTNNERVGVLGVSCTGGAAIFRDWSCKPR